MKLFLFGSFLLFLSFKTFAYECSNIKPFVAGGQQNIKVTVSKFSWSQGNSGYEDVCSSNATMNWYDVRGREQDAYYCLKPNPTEVIVCKTKIANDEAEVEVVPASWIRTWQPSPIREYRFHAYVVKKSDPNFYYDIFSRSLNTNLVSDNIIVEGSLKTGSSNPDDGFWIRTEFTK